MQTGSLQTIITCAPSSTGASVQPCADTAAGPTSPQLVQAYVLHPTQAPFIDSVTEPFDAQQAGAVFSMSFVSVVGLYLLTSNLAHVLRMIRG